MLDLAYKALTAKYPAVSTKNRLGEPTHDVLCVVRYRGYLVEIQFHFRYDFWTMFPDFYSAMPPKSHVPCNRLYFVRMLIGADWCL